MKIGLSGYGKMGKEIETIALQRGHTIVLKIEEANRSSVTIKNIQGCDVIIDFSTPHAVMDNIQLVMDAGVPMVVGTTGWHQHLEEVKKLCLEKNGSLVFGSNFSVGVNIFFALNQYLAGIMDKYPGYEPKVHEVHHTQKLDAPSGTAITLAKDIVEKLERKSQWIHPEKKDPSDLLITADRIENIPGTHTITYESEIDTIEITHTAHNRQGFALGALMSAEWITGKKGFFEVKEMFSF